MEDGQNQQPDETNENPMLRDPAQPPHPVTRRERRHHKKLLLFGVGGAILALLLAGGLYWFFLRGDDTKQSAQSATGTQEQTTKVTPLPSTDPTPVTFKSTKLNIELTHRKDWKLKESSDGEINITSPQTSIVDVDGQAAMGVFTFKIRKGVSSAMKATIEKSIATRDSEVIAYAAPTEQQRQYTNLSYVGGQKDVFNFFIVTGSTELKTGNALAYTLPLDDEYYLIVGGYGVAGSNLAFDSVPKASMDSGALEQAIAIAESLKIY